MGVYFVFLSEYYQDIK